ncbi:MAG: M28 family peptidase [Candidatus Aminicenantaceae bacterium]
MFYTNMPGRSHKGLLPELTDEELIIKKNMMQHIEFMAGNIGERNIWKYQALNACANYIEEVLTGMGYEVESQYFRVEGREFRNIEVELKGWKKPDEIILWGAHYDTIFGSPGANDNASGIAALLELARKAAGCQFERSVRFAAFVNEEPPFFKTDNMGSYVYSHNARASGENIVSMICLETIGCYSNKRGSQKYPFPLSRFYPGTGNFLAFVGNLASKDLVCQSIAAFRKHAAFPSEGIAAPSWLTGIDWSDQWSFWKKDYPAVMITDTALFRYNYYHSPEDTPEKLNYSSLARVLTGLDWVIKNLTCSGIE